MPVFQVGVVIRKTEFTDLIVRVEASDERAARAKARELAEHRSRRAQSETALFNDSPDWELSEFESDDDSDAAFPMDGPMAYDADIDTVTVHDPHPSHKRGDGGPNATACGRFYALSVIGTDLALTTCPKCLAKRLGSSG